MTKMHPELTPWKIYGVRDKVIAFFGENIPGSPQFKAVGDFLLNERMSIERGKIKAQLHLLDGMYPNERETFLEDLEFLNIKKAVLEINISREKYSTPGYKERLSEIRDLTGELEIAIKKEGDVDDPRVEAIDNIEKLMNGWRPNQSY